MFDYGKMVPHVVSVGSPNTNCRFLEYSREKVTGLLEISNIEAGLQTVAWLREGMDGEAVLNQFYRRRPSKQGLQLGFAAVDPREIRRGIQQLAAALEEQRTARRF
jgi:GntR family transcriptional regulator / MocR family aminotransferase